MNTFDRDLPIGLDGEKLLKRIAINYVQRGEAAIEVKTDQKCLEHGNVFVEIESRGKPSGIMTQKTPYWCYILDGPGYNRGAMVIIERERLLKIASKFPKVKGGDDNTSLGHLVPLLRLLSPMPIDKAQPAL